MIDHPSPNFDARAGAVDLVVLHYTGMQDGPTALRRLCDPAPKAGDYPGPWQPADIDPAAPLARVSAHYLVGEDGAVYRVVPEDKRAWHAGQSNWEGRGDVNSRAIGIEIVNGGHDFGLPPYPDAQIDAVIALVRDILKRRALGPHRVVGHSDIAPARKADPGEHFPWKRLADAGVSLWPDVDAADDRIFCKPGDRGEDVHFLHAALAAFGYAAPEDASPRAAHYSEETKAIVTAVQRRFTPHALDGVARVGMMRALDDLIDQVEALEEG
ncbi:MAG: N-acetylmuramoyl-L-alanine amidase [Hyphomonadaceae bacterium]|nr:N-acetylmuramoyl-L-alanine amidase [Hyphomonadaceae bacterium]